MRMVVVSLFRISARSPPALAYRDATRIPKKKSSIAELKRGTLCRSGLHLQSHLHCKRPPIDGGNLRIVDRSPVERSGWMTQAYSMPITSYIYIQWLAPNLRDFGRVCFTTTCKFYVHRGGGLPSNREGLIIQRPAGIAQLVEQPPCKR